MATVNRIIKLLIQADASGVRPGVNSATQALEGLNTVASGLRNTLAALGVSLSFAGLALGVKRAIDAADQMGKAAASIGLTTEALSVLDFAGRQASLTQEQLRNGQIGRAHV